MTNPSSELTDPTPDPGARQLRVAVWHWGRRGGGAQYTYEMARELARRADVRLSLFLSAGVEGRSDYDALPAATWYARTYTSMNPSTQRRPSDFLHTVGLMFRLPAVLLRFARMLRSQDVVLCTMLHPLNSLASWLIRRSGAHYVLVLHEPTSDRATYGAIIRVVTDLEVRRSDGVVLLSESAGRVFAARFGENSVPRVTLPLGSFRYGHNRPRRFPANRPVRLLFFGRIDQYKGIDLLLDAYARLRHDDLPVTLSIVGAGDLSPYRAALAAVTDVHVVNEWVDEAQIGAILDEHDVCILPYLHSSQSAVVPMAQYAGLPVVTTPVGGLVEQVTDGETGAVAADMTPEAVAAAVASLLTPKRYERLSRGASEYARDGLDWSAIGDRLMGFVAQLASARALRD
jgi:glycosyltransferase involved in cell wall biosynthesis